ncbi:MAG: hypothetical protein AAFO94_13750, partial [Bacteroidota bacterium]
MNTRLMLLAIALLSFGFSPKKALLEKANEAYQLKAYHLAIKYYEAYLRKQPACDAASAQLADCYWQTYQTNKSATIYQQYLQCPARQPEHYKRYAKVLRSLGQYDKAKEQLFIYAAFDEKEAVRLILSCDWAASQQTSATHRLDSLSQNSLAGDYGASFLNDQIIFSSSRIHAERVTFFPYADNLLYQFDRPEQIRKYGYQLPVAHPVRQAGNMGPIHFSPDGRLAAFSFNDFVEGSRPLLGNFSPLQLYWMEKDSSGQYSEPTAFEFNQAEVSAAYPSFSTTGDSLFFASDHEGGFGGYDLYLVTRLPNGNWSQPQNLGPEINTPGHEITPALSKDELFFASDYYKGMGGFDLFRAVVDEDGFLCIHQLGKGINSAGDDYGISFHESGQYAVLTSNRGGVKSGEDIYMLQAVEKGQTLSFAAQPVGQHAFTQAGSLLLSAQQRVKLDTDIARLATPTLRPLYHQAQTTVQLQLSEPAPNTTNQIVASAPVRSVEPSIILTPQFDGRSPYQIRVKTMKTGETFDESQLLQWGKLKQKTWKDFTIVFLHGYASKADASAALKSIQG